MTTAPAPRPTRIFVSAGEVSGDLILGEVLPRLRAGLGALELRGLGGPAAQACGLDPLFPIARTGFSGAWDVLANGLFAVRMYFAAARALREFRPDLVILVDYPGLNLRLAREARRLGFPVHFIAPPQVWVYREAAGLTPEGAPPAAAARAGRKLRRARAALQGCSLQPMFPFEAPYWEGCAAAIHPGHFQDTVFRRLPSREAGAALLCLCPGSRLPVLRRNLPAWLALLAAAGVPSGEPIAILAPEQLAEAARGLVRRHAPERGAACAVRTDKAAVLAAADRAIAFPGTVTLELALHRIPTLTLALIDPLTYAIGKRILTGRRLSLPNLLLGEDLFPEWAGTLPGPGPEAFRAGLAGLGAPSDGTGESGNYRDWDHKLEKLARRIGPGNGAGIAAQACLALLPGAPVS